MTDILEGERAGWGFDFRQKAMAGEGYCDEREVDVEYPAPV